MSIDTAQHSSAAFGGRVIAGAVQRALYYNLYCTINTVQYTQCTVRAGICRGDGEGRLTVESPKAALDRK